MHGKIYLLAVKIFYKVHLSLREYCITSEGTGIKIPYIHPMKKLIVSIISCLILFPLSIIAQSRNAPVRSRKQAAAPARKRAIGHLLPSGSGATLVGLRLTYVNLGQSFPVRRWRRRVQARPGDASGSRRLKSRRARAANMVNRRNAGGTGGTQLVTDASAGIKPRRAMAPAA